MGKCTAGQPLMFATCAMIHDSMTPAQRSTQSLRLKKKGREMKTQFTQSRMSHFSVETATWSFKIKSKFHQQPISKRKKLNKVEIVSESFQNCIWYVQYNGTQDMGSTSGPRLQ